MLSALSGRLLSVFLFFFSEGVRENWRAGTFRLLFSPHQQLVGRNHGNVLAEPFGNVQF
jgi:hypothetical protein